MQSVHIVIVGVCTLSACRIAKRMGTGPLETEDHSATMNFAHLSQNHMPPFLPFLRVRERFWTFSTGCCNLIKIGQAFLQPWQGSPSSVVSESGWPLPCNTGCAFCAGIFGFWPQNDEASALQGRQVTCTNERQPCCDCVSSMCTWTLVYAPFWVTLCLSPTFRPCVSNLPSITTG